MMTNNDKLRNVTSFLVHVFQVNLILHATSMTRYICMSTKTKTQLTQKKNLKLFFLVKVTLDTESNFFNYVQANF